MQQQISGRRAAAALAAATAAVVGRHLAALATPEEQGRRHGFRSSRKRRSQTVSSCNAAAPAHVRPFKKDSSSKFRVITITDTSFHPLHITWDLWPISRDRNNTRDVIFTYF